MEIRIDRRFRGPPNSGNGGYVCGVIASLIGPSAEITLRRPIPLDRPLFLQRRDHGAVLLDGEALLAEGQPAVLDVATPLHARFAAAQEASARVSENDHRHPLPGCFVCGPERSPGDGLRLRPGPIGDGILAAPWVPTTDLCDAGGQVAEEFVWSVLDCPTGFAALGVEQDRPVLLGRLAAEVRQRPRAGDRCVIAARAAGAEGRKLYAEAALLDEAGMMLASARATWILVSRDLLTGAGIGG